MILESKQTNQNEKGFTLLEIIIAIALMTILMAILIPGVMSAVKYYEYFENKVQMQKVAKAIEVTYSEYAMAIDSNPADNGSTITFGWSSGSGGSGSGSGSSTIAGSGNPITTPGSSEVVQPETAYYLGNPKSIQSGFKVIADNSGESPVQLATDGYGRPFMIYVSPQLYTVYEGYPLYYHDIAIVSNNGQGLKKGSGGDIQNVGKTTFTCYQGETSSYCSLQLGRDVSGDVISGFKIQQKLLNYTIKNIDQIASAYSTFFTANYLQSSSRILGCDYFYQNSTTTQCTPYEINGNTITTTTSNSYTFPSYDTNGKSQQEATLNSSGSPFQPQISSALPLAQNNNSDYLLQALGFTSSGSSIPNNAYSGWGYSLGYSNVSPNIRDASNTSNPPFTAAIYAWAPHGILVSDIIAGSY